VCADCHVNTHPRWASWSLGVFICIRCSGIHRGMGTHISRVKSADLDAWTDEQTAMMLKWGNRRANKYRSLSLKTTLYRIALSYVCCCALVGCSSYVAICFYVAGILKLCCHYTASILLVSCYYVAVMLLLFLFIY